MISALVFMAITPSANVSSLTKNSAAMSRVRDLGVLRCNRSTLLRKGSSPGISCRIALLAANAPKTAGVSPRNPSYAKQAAERVSYLREALKTAGELRRKLTGAKDPVPAWKLKWALHATSKACELPEAFAMESRIAPKQAQSVRDWAVKGIGGVPIRKLTCDCLNNLNAIAQLLPKDDARRKEATRGLRRSGCRVQRFQTNRETEYILPTRNLAKGQRDAVKTAKKKLDSNRPKRMVSARRVLKRYRKEITGCAAEAKRRGGDLAKRRKSMQRCICPSANRWRFPPGPVVTVAEDGPRGAMVLSLTIGKAGRVKACQAIIK